MFKDTSMEQIKNLLAENQDKFIKLTLSSPLRKDALYFKITAERKLNNGGAFYHITYFYGTKVKHENIGDTLSMCEAIMQNAAHKQWDLVFTDRNINIFVNKNGTVKLRETKAVNASRTEGHDAHKNYMLKESEPVEWLIRLGVMNESGKVYSDMQKKFRQINKFLETSEDILAALPDDAVIVDVGCGKSYLTFALYHRLNVMMGKHVKIVGIDLKADVLEFCSILADELGFAGMSFQNIPVEAFEPEARVDMVVCLHACDTATDYALYGAVKWNSDYIISVPCCQHELFGQIKNAPLSPMLKHGVLKERFAAMLTDTIRAMALEVNSYNCQIIEFVDIEHSTKNIMLKCKKINSRTHGRAVREANDQHQELRELCKSFNVTPKLCVLLGLI